MIKQAGITDPNKQLLINAINPSDPCPQIFHLEDDALIQKLHSYYELMRKRKNHE